MDKKKVLANADKKLRTPSGSPTAYARAKHGGKNGEYPVFDAESAAAAQHLIDTGHGTPAERSAAQARVTAWKKNHK